MKSRERSERDFHSEATGSARAQRRPGPIPGRPRLVALFCLFAAACGGPEAQTPAASGKDTTARVRAFEEMEDEILRDLSTVDGRFARRARITPRPADLDRIAMQALLAEDPTVAVIDGAIDPFSFEARARGLAAAKKKIAGLPTDLPKTAGGPTQSPAFERDLLAHLVDEEVLRLEEERALPRSASALVRAVVDTWCPPKTPEEAEGRDRWLAKRLDEVQDSLAAVTTSARTPNAAAALDPVRARELDDALDALEHLIDVPGFTKATQALVRVRNALESHSARPAEAARSEWSDVAKRIKMHLGVTYTGENIELMLAGAQKRLAAMAKAAREPSATQERAKIDADTHARQLARVMFATGECADNVSGSRVRSMSPPAERLAVCHLRQAVARAEPSGITLAVAYAALHDHVVVARWALEVARGTATIAQASSKHHFLTPAALDERARYERIALARPVLAIGAGLAATLLVVGDNPPKQARAWALLGDVPLDIAGTELQLRPVDAR